MFIMVDDMRDDELAYMPWTRKLIRDQGVRFSNSLSPFPLCCPARASVFTGQYTHNHGVYGVFPPYGFSSFDDRSTIATWLQDAGYWTGYVGKYLNQYGIGPPRGVAFGNSVRYVPPGWNDWRASIDGGLPRNSPFSGSTYWYYDTTLSRNGTGFNDYRGQYQTTVYGQLAQRIIRQRSASAQPFFFYLSFTAPHSGAPLEPDDPRLIPRDNSGPRIGTPARPDWIKGAFDKVIGSAPGALIEENRFRDKPKFLRNDPPLSPAEWDAVLSLTRQRAESLAVVDLQVKRVVRALKSTGALDNTFVVFTSDNGYFLGEQRRRQGKIFPYGPSLTVPLVMRGPGIPAGETRNDPFTSIDFAPTFASIAQVVPPAPVDGLSLLDVAQNGDQGWSRAILTETGPMFRAVRNTDVQGRSLQPGEARDVRFIIGIRTERYLYTDIATGEEELYDLAKDPNETTNLIKDPRYNDTLALLRHQLSLLRDCSGNQCRAPLPNGIR